MPGGIGPLELGIVLLIVLIVFGPKRLPSLGRQLGSGMREFKESITGKHDDEDDAPKAVAAAPATSTTPAAAPEVVTAEARPQDQPVTPTDR